VANPPIPASVKSEKVFARFRPLAPGSKFVSQVRVHNLQPHELGALLWALDFGGAEGVFHALGGVKPLGYGRVKLQVRGWQVAPLAEWSTDPLADSATGGPRDAVADKAALIKAYVDWMEEHVTGWQKSEQLRELVACARPLPAGSRDGRYMSVERPNEFQQVKKEGLALRLASGSARRVVKLPAAGSATAAAAAADAWMVATVEQFRDAKVRLKLDTGSVLNVLLDTRVFTEQDWKKPRLNGNDFPAGRRVELILADAKVVRVRPK
jgi:hypothetical protein